MKMKRFILILFCSIFTSIVSAQSPYFCTEVGKKALRGYYDGNDKLTMYNECEVASATANGDVITVVIHNVMLSPDKTSFPYILPYDMTYEIRKGDVYPILAANDKEIDKLGNMSIPSDMKVGDDYGSGEYKIEASGIANRATIHYRKVTGEESVTTPAGTFDCVILEQLSEMRVLGIKQKSVTKTWYAKNVGDVKSEIYTVKGKLRSKVVLEEFK